MDVREKLVRVIKRLDVGPFIGGVEAGLSDLNVEVPSFSKAGLRICILQTGLVEPKLMSNTVSQLIALCNDGGLDVPGGVYVDTGMRPGQRDCGVLRGIGVPEVFGWGSLRTLDEFDVIMVTFGVHFESAGILATFWGGGLSPFFSERGENDPFIIGGGVVAQYLESLFGHKKGALLDLLYLGEGEVRLPLLVKSLYDKKDRLRSDRIGVIKELVTQYDNLYFPDGYQHVYEGVKLCEIKRQFDWVPEKVKFFRSFDTTPTIFEQRAMITSNDKAGRAALRISQGCSGSGCCSFCAEGSESGPWREHDTEHIKSRFDTLVRYSAPNLLSYYAYNLNYHTGYVDLLKYGAERFKSQSVIAMRADVIAESPGYVGFLKSLGNNRLSIALEGISERIREKYYHKGVSWEQFHSVGEQVFAGGIGVLKVNFIWSGYETEEDYAELLEHLKQFLKRRDEVGARVKLALSVTVLVTYLNTGMQWSPRRSIVRLLRGVKEIYNLFEACRALGVGVKLHSGYEYTFQQLLIDAGRLISEDVYGWYREVWEKNGALYYPLQDLIGRIYLTLGLDSPEKIEGYYLREREYNELTPVSSYDIIPETTRQLWYRTVGKEGLSYCLRTVSNKGAKCHGCGICSRELKQSIIERPVDAPGFDGIEQIQRLNKVGCRLRVLYTVSGDSVSECRHKIVMNHVLAGRVVGLLGLESSFHSVDNYSDKAECKHDMVDVWGGLGCFDIKFRCEKDEVDRAVQGIDWRWVHMEGVKILGVQSYACDSFRVSFGSVWRFDGENLMAVNMMDKLSEYTGEVKLKVQGVSTTIGMGMVLLDKKEIGLNLKQVGCGVTGYMYLPGVNPLFTLSSLFSLPLLKVRDQVRMRRVFLLERGMGICRSCGAESGIDVFRGEMSKVCGKCMSVWFFKRN